MTRRPIIFIAEVGVNHNGSLKRAMEMVDVAADAGADFVKFQTFKAEKLVTRSAPKAEYQARQGDGEESQFEMLARLELDEDAHKVLVDHCAAHGIGFMSTPFDGGSVKYLVDTLNIGVVKISSGDMLDPMVLLPLAKRGVDIILSTGMADLKDVELALGMLAFGYSCSDAPATVEAFQNAWQDPDCRAKVRRHVRVLHCTTEYPAPLDEVNLLAMGAIQKAFDVQVGYSDHTKNGTASVAAAALGACVIEKHFTLDRTLPGPDHRASVEPRELKEIIHQVREVTMMMGDGNKQPTASEIKNMAIARKSLVAVMDIQEGHVIEEKDVVIKRPGTGLSPVCYWDVIGKPATRFCSKDEPLPYDAVSGVYDFKKTKLEN